MDPQRPGVCGIDPGLLKRCNDKSGGFVETLVQAAIRGDGVFRRLNDGG